jgi:hypothetical protein
LRGKGKCRDKGSAKEIGRKGNSAFISSGLVDDGARLPLLPFAGDFEM